MDWLNVDVIAFEYFVIVFARLSALIAFAPIIGGGNVPPQAKIGLSFFLSMIIYPIVVRDFPPLPDHIIMFWLFVVRESLIGALMGVLGNLMFVAVQLSGQIFGMQVGFGIVNVIDPVSDTQVSILGQFQFLIAILLFLGINAHHVFIRMIAESYSLLPMGTFQVTKGMAGEVTLWLGKTFMMAVRLGSPMIFTLLLVSVALGIIARTVPQMNVFIVGLPLQIFVGLFMIAVTMGMMIMVLRGYFDVMFVEMFRFMKAASGR